MAGLLCLMAPPTYVAASGPVLHAETRGWLPSDTYLVTFHPLHRTIYALDGSGRWLQRGHSAYTHWWSNLSPTFRPVRIAAPYP